MPERSDHSGKLFKGCSRREALDRGRLFPCHQVVSRSLGIALEGKYLQTQAAESAERILDLLEVWATEARDPERKKQARAALYGLGVRVAVSPVNCLTA